MSAKISFAMMSVASCLALSALASSAQAALVTYDFTPGSSYSGNGDWANLSGSFVYDTSSASIVSSNITLSGYDNTGSTKGATNCTACASGLADAAGYHFATNLGPQALYLAFSSSLNAGGASSLALTAPEGNQAEYQAGFPFNSVAGGVTPDAVPEASTWALMVLGFGGRRVRCSRAGVARPRLIRRYCMELWTGTSLRSMILAKKSILLITPRRR